MSDNDKRKFQDAGRPEEAGGLLASRPTVAPNIGSAIPDRLLRGFAKHDGTEPEWMRLPAPRARCRLTGLSRTGLNEAIERGEIRAITIRQPGATRGVKLVNVASVRTWLTRLDTEQNTLARESGVTSADVEGGVR